MTLHFFKWLSVNLTLSAMNTEPSSYIVSLFFWTFKFTCFRKRFINVVAFSNEHDVFCTVPRLYPIDNLLSTPLICISLTNQCFVPRINSTTWFDNVQLCVRWARCFRQVELPIFKSTTLNLINCANTWSLPLACRRPLNSDCFFLSNEILCPCRNRRLFTSANCAVMHVNWRRSL